VGVAADCLDSIISFKSALLSLHLESTCRLYCSGLGILPNAVEETSEDNKNCTFGTHQ